MEKNLNTDFPRDRIIVSDLELNAHVGVPDFERSKSQRLTLNLVLIPKRSFGGLDDAIENTVDYFVLTRRIQSIAAERPRKLIETLVEEIAFCVLREFAVEEVDAELRKYILPDTEFVAVRINRTAKPLGN